MSRTARNVNLLAVIVPFLAFLGALVLLWNRAVGPLDLAILAGMYLLSGIGVTVGFHRLLTHRAFETHRPLKYVFAVLGSLSVQGPVITWVADHRKHHAHADEEGDPHSPHVGHGSGLRGLLHAHMGWLVRDMGRAERRRYAPDLMEDPGMRRINRSFELIVVAGLAIPFALGFLLGGTLTAALTALLWGGLVRVFLLDHVTWSINSVCHFFGRRRFNVEDESRNVFWLAPFSMGESWHHNHHAFPTSAFHGLRFWERLADPTGLLIALLEKLGIVWNVVRVSPERQRAKALPPSHVEPRGASSPG